MCSLHRTLCCERLPTSVSTIISAVSLVIRRPFYCFVSVYLNVVARSVSRRCFILFPAVSYRLSLRVHLQKCPHCRINTHRKLLFYYYFHKQTAFFKTKRGKKKSHPGPFVVSDSNIKASSLVLFNIPSCRRLTSITRELKIAGIRKD